MGAQTADRSSRTSAAKASRRRGVGAAGAGLRSVLSATSEAIQAPPPTGYRTRDFAVSPIRRGPTAEQREPPLARTVGADVLRHLYREQLQSPGLGEHGGRINLVHVGEAAQACLALTPAVLERHEPDAAWN